MPPGGRSRGSVPFTGGRVPRRGAPALHGCCSPRNTGPSILLAAIRAQSTIADRSRIVYTVCNIHIKRKETLWWIRMLRWCCPGSGRAMRRIGNGCWRSRQGTSRSSGRAGRHAGACSSSPGSIARGPTADAAPLRARSVGGGGAGGAVARPGHGDTGRRATARHPLRGRRRSRRRPRAPRRSGGCPRRWRPAPRRRGAGIGDGSPARLTGPEPQ